MKSTVFHILILGFTLIVPRSYSQTGDPRNEKANPDPFTCAVLVAQSISFSEFKGNALADVVGYFIEAEQFDKALDLTRSIERASSKVESLALIAEAYSKQGRQDQALKLLSEAFDLAKASDREDLHNRFIFTYVARGYIEIGEPETTLPLIEKVEGEPRVKADALLKLAIKFAGNGGFVESLRIASTIESTFTRSKAFAELAFEFVKKGKKKESLQLLDQALALARKVDPPTLKVRALIEVSDKYAETGNKKLAASVLDEAFQASKSRTTEDNAYKAQALSELASAYAIRGNYDKAFVIVETTEEPNSKGELIVKIARPDYFDIALRLTRTFSDNYVKAKTLAGLAVKYADAGKPNEALNLLGQALDAANIAEDNYYKAMALADVGMNYFKVGQKEKGTQVLTNSLEVAASIPDAYHKSRALAIIGLTYAQAGQTPDNSASRILKRIVSNL